MEDVLDTYSLPYNPVRPVVCMDEQPYQLLGESRNPLPMKPKSKKKLDSEYVRNGTCSIFMFCEPRVPSNEIQGFTPALLMESIIGSNTTGVHYGEQTIIQKTKDYVNDKVSELKQQIKKLFLE